MKTLFHSLLTILAFGLSSPLPAAQENLVIAPTLTLRVDFSPVREVFWKTFASLDTDKKGYLVKEDFKASTVLWIASWRYFDQIDTNADSRVSRAEMEVFVLAQEAKQRGRFVKAWKKYDTNLDGLLSRHEVSDSFFMTARFDGADTNADGFLDPKELIRSLADGLESIGF